MANKKPKAFNTLDSITNPPSDHHYIKSKQAHINPKLAQRITQEWKLLNSSLPDSIFVQVYDSNINLMRAAIIGPQGTPYSNGLFFFDILFPNNYGAAPPDVYFHSYGLPLNPNLYTDGYVCLSLLNTWSGSKKEKWNKCYSNILQVLVSIQGLVLNSEPYKNEPFRIRFLENWVYRHYNNDVFMLTMKAMVYTLRKPPKGFECFVAGHFEERANEILVKCRASLGLSKCMRELFYKLAAAFEANGAKCQHLVDEVRKEESLKIQSKGVFRKIWKELVNLMSL